MSNSKPAKPKDKSQDKLKKEFPKRSFKIKTDVPKLIKILRSIPQAQDAQGHN